MHPIDQCLWVHLDGLSAVQQVVWTFLLLPIIFYHLYTNIKYWGAKTCYSSKNQLTGFRDNGFLVAVRTILIRYKGLDFEIFCWEETAEYDARLLVSLCRSPRLLLCRDVSKMFARSRTFEEHLYLVELFPVKQISLESSRTLYSIKYL